MADLSFLRNNDPRNKARDNHFKKQKAQKKNGRGLNVKGSKDIFSTAQHYQKAMILCGEVSSIYNEYVEDKNAFLQQDDWELVQQKNRARKTDEFDAKWAHMIGSWQDKNFFDAGKYWAEIYLLLSKFDD